MRDHSLGRAEEWLDRGSAGVERSMLAARCGVSRPSVTNLTKRFAPFVDEDRPGARGPAPTTIALRPDLGYAVGVDFGSRHDRVAVGDAQGAVYAANPEHYERPKARGTSPSASLDWAADRITNLLDEIDARPESVIGVGVSLAGPVARATGLLHPSALIEPSWRDLNAAAELQRRLGWDRIDFRTDNDANLGAMTQLTWGAARAFEHAVYVRWSEVIGFGLIVDGEIYRGARGLAGEAGHMVVDRTSSAVCSRCGHAGCLQALAAPESILNEVDVERVSNRPSEQLVELASEHPHLVAPAAEAVGQAVAAAVNLLEPEAVVIGGPVGARAFDVIAPSLRKALDDSAMGFARDVMLVREHEVSQAAVRGAIALALRDNLVDYITARIDAEDRPSAVARG